MEKAKGAQVRSRIRWVEEGESSSAYFFRLERKRAADAWGSALRESDGTIVSSPDDLCHSFASFFSYLFTASSTDPVAQETLLDKVSATLSSDKAKQCEGMLSIEECYATFIGMAKRKVPRIDGFPMEFYVKFWGVLGSDLVEVLNDCYSSRSLTLSQCRGITSLVFKRGHRLDAHN